MNEEQKLIRVGMKVPDFKTEAYDPESGKFSEISLKNLQKSDLWTILFFYPADFTFVCPTELSDLSDKYEELKKIGVQVISVSTDTKFTHLAWTKHEKLVQDIKFPMASDTTGALSKLFGIYDEKSGLALRGTFIINPEGILVSSEVNFYHVGRNADELFRKMQANSYLIKAPAEACPAKWKPGEKTLKPSELIVGKVYEALNQ